MSHFEAGERIMRGCYHGSRRRWTVFRRWVLVAVCGAAVGLAACDSDPFPSALEGYTTRDSCVVMNLDPVPEDEDVPHPGYKTIYACHDDDPGILFEGDAWIGPPYPDGTLFIKESCMDGECSEVPEDFVFLIATAEKIAGQWEWHEYMRNFEEEPLLEVPFPESACVDCHRKVEAGDWMYTGYQSR
jgi:hypothetical protein